MQPAALFEVRPTTIRHRRFRLRRPTVVSWVWLAVALHGAPVAVADASKLNPLDAASACAESVSDPARHFMIQAEATGDYLPYPGYWDTEDCEEAQAATTLPKAARLAKLITAVVVEIELLMSHDEEIRELLQTSASPAVLRQAAAAQAARSKRMLVAFRALNDHLAEARLARDKHDLAALTNQEKPAPRKSARLYELTLRLATHEVGEALSARNHPALVKQLRIIAAAAAGLAIAPTADPDLTADYAKAVLQLHRAASQVTASWPPGKVADVEAALRDVSAEADRM